MLLPYQEPVFSRQDELIFDALVRYDHWTRWADKTIDFLALRKSIEPLFKESGRPAMEPVLFLKMEFLMFHDGLSDSQLFQRCETDMAYRRFLGLGLSHPLPDDSTLRKFRGRIGADGHRQVFHALLEQARGLGLVKDRLRIKDATHVLANIAIPAGLQLVAQARNKLLLAAEPFDAEQVAGERVRTETIRTSTDDCGNEAPLVARVEHLRDILAWVEELKPLPNAETSTAWQTLQEAIEIARKVLQGHDDPKMPKKIRSTVDPDARRGKHGEFFDGYFVDAMIDADSELFTSINVYSAGESESADTLVLVEQERNAHGNQIEKLSIDGAGQDGAMIRELESPAYGSIEVFVPPRKLTNGGKFTADDFALSADGSSVTCPAGHQSSTKQDLPDRHTSSFKFVDSTCRNCSLRSQCVKESQKNGRTVKKTDYDVEHKRLHERAQTDVYREVKKEHPKIERRLGELINRHGGRHARYRGLERVSIQQILGATVANLMRMLRLTECNFVI
jgi:IS5 family transposase